MPRKSQISSPLSFWATELAYGGIQAYQNDKDAGRTNLDYRYWLAARTPEFKAEFGPWEQLRAERNVHAMESLNVQHPIEWSGLSLEEIRGEMNKELNRVKGSERGGKPPIPILHPQLGHIRVGKAGIGKSKNTSGDPAKILVASQIISLLPKSVYSQSEPLYKAKRDPQIVGYSRLLAKVNVDGLPLVAVFTIERKTDGNWYYNTVVLLDEKRKTREFQIDGLTRTVPVQGAPLAGLLERKRTPFERVKSAFVSKELNPETGEPTARAIGQFLDLSLSVGDSTKWGTFRALDPESQKLIHTAKQLREAYHAETRKEGKMRVRESAKGISKSIDGPGQTAISLRAALMAFITGKGGEQPLREFALAHDRAIARSRELLRGKSQSSGHSLGIDL